jgi:hypothetical protein
MRRRPGARPVRAASRRPRSQRSSYRPPSARRSRESSRGGRKSAYSRDWLLDRRRVERSHPGRPDWRRSRLFRQPGSLERRAKLRASGEHFNPGDLAIADPPRKEDRVADASVAPRHQAGDAPHADYLVAAIVKAIDLLAPPRQALPLGSNHGDKSFMTSPRARLNGRGGIDVLDLRISKGEHRLDVLAVPSVQDAPHDLYVLLRHRPGSIARAGKLQRVGAPVPGAVAVGAVGRLGPPHREPNSGSSTR